MIESALKRYLSTQREIIRLVDNNIFSGRIPQYRLKDESCDTAIILQTVSGDTFEDLPGEGDCEVAVIQVESLARGQGAARRAYDTMNAVRKVTTKNAFVDYVGHGEHRHWVKSMTTQRIGGPIPVGPNDASDRWTHRYSRDLRIVFEYGDE